MTVVLERCWVPVLAETPASLAQILRSKFRDGILMRPDLYHPNSIRHDIVQILITLLNSVDNGRYTLPAFTWRARENPFETSGETLEPACSDEVMMLAGSETAASHCQSALVVRTALWKKRGEADGMEARPSHGGNCGKIHTPVASSSLCRAVPELKLCLRQFSSYHRSW
jgi:hypothetical protein